MLFDVVLCYNSFMVHNFIDMTGGKYGRWKVIEYHGNSKWLCLCNCGTEKIVNGKYLRDGQSKSCGCLANEIASERIKTHGMTGTKPYRTWRNMINRCTNKNVPEYKHYGGRGIKVCDRWNNSFSNFWEDMKNEYRENLSLDRVNNDGDYSPENCRWTDKINQANNTRVVKKITHNGETKTLTEWSIKTGIKRSTLANRYFTYKWSIKDMLEIPVINNGRHHSFFNPSL